MKISHLAALAALGAATSLHAATVVTNFNWDGDTLGAPVPTSFPGVDPQPQGIVYSTGGFPDSGTYTGSVTVQNAGGFNHAALMTTTDGGIGSNYIDTQFLSAPGHLTKVSFDLNILTTPATAVPQDGVGAPNGQAFVIQGFTQENAGDRAFRFVAAPTSGTGGQFALRDPGGAGDLTDFFPYTDGTIYHVDLLVHFDTGLVDAFINGNLELANQPFVNTPGDNLDGLDELFIFQNGVEGVANTVALDNLVTTTNIVPEPATLGVLGCGAGMMLLRKRRSH